MSKLTTSNSQESLLNKERFICVFNELLKPGTFQKKYVIITPVLTKIKPLDEVILDVVVGGTNDLDFSDDYIYHMPIIDLSPGEIKSRLDVFDTHEIFSKYVFQKQGFAMPILLAQDSDHNFTVEKDYFSTIISESLTRMIIDTIKDFDNLKGYFI